MEGGDYIITPEEIRKLDGRVAIFDIQFWGKQPYEFALLDVKSGRYVFGYMDLPKIKTHPFRNPTETSRTVNNFKYSPDKLAFLSRQDLRFILKDYDYLIFRGQKKMMVIKEFTRAKFKTFYTPIKELDNILHSSCQLHNSVYEKCAKEIVIAMYNKI